MSRPSAGRLSANARVRLRLTPLLASPTRYNRGGLFSWAVGADERNSSRHILQLDQAALGLPSSAYYSANGTNANVLQAYERYMIRLAQMLHRSELLYRKQSKYEALMRRDRPKDNATLPPALELHLGSERLFELSALFDRPAGSNVAPDLKNYEHQLLDEFEADKEIERQMKLVLQFEVELANVSPVSFPFSFRVSLAIGLK